MKSNLGKSVAEHIISNNQKLHVQLITVKKDLKLIENKMMQALDKLSLTYSSKLKGCTKLLLFDNPYQCLAAFVEEMAKTATTSISTAEENQQLLQQNRKLQYRITSIQTQLQQRNRNQQQTIKHLNKQIHEKKTELKKLQEDYQQVLTSKKIAEKQLSDTKQYMKILRLKLYQEQREKLTEIIVANKKEMIDFRRSVEMQAYKQQLQYKKCMEQKDLQIRTLTKNIQDLINDKLTATSDLTVLQKIVQPIRDMTALRNQIAGLKKGMDHMKQEIRDKYGVILGLQGKMADTNMVRDNLLSHNERLEIEKKLLSKQLAQTKQQLQKQIKDRQALDLYYSEKWHGEFSKVRENLQEKYLERSKKLQQQFKQKRRQVQAQILGHIQRLRVMKNQVNDVKRRNSQLIEINARQLSQINSANFKNNQLHQVIRQAQQFHTQQLSVNSFQLNSRIVLFKTQLYQQKRINQHLQAQLKERLLQLETSRNNFLLQKQQEIKSLNEIHRGQIQSLCMKHKMEMQQLQRQYSNSKQAMEQFKIDQTKKFESKQKQLLQCHVEKVKQIQTSCDSKIKRANQKLCESEQKYQKLRKSKQDELQQATNNLTQAQRILHQRQLQIISRDIELSQYRKMKDTYMAEISRLNKSVNQETFMNESLRTEIQAMTKCLQEKQKLVQTLQSKRYMFKNQLQQFQKSYRKQFDSLLQTQRKITQINKRKIKQLQLLFQQRPMKQQHFEKMQSLEKKNSQLRTQIHLKQAENLILNQVKDYYEQKAFTFSTSNAQHNHLRPDHNHNETVEMTNKNELLATCTFLKTCNTFLRPTVGNQQRVNIVKKYRSRKNKLITSSYNKFDAFQQDEKGQSSEISRMKRYLSKQHQRGNVTATNLEGQQVRGYERTKSSIG